MTRSALAAALLGLLVAGTAAAQSTYPNVKLTGRLQADFYDFNNPTGTASQSSFYVRRARITVKGHLADNISFIVQPNYTTGQAGVTLKDAFVDVSFSKPEAPSSLVLRVGQFKRFFGRYENTSSNNLPSLERGAYKGLLGVASNDLAVGNGFEAHDLGAGLIFTGLDKKLAIMGAVMNGASSVNALDVNRAKSFYARATYALTPMLSVGGSFGSHDFIRPAAGLQPADSSARNTGWGVDAQWGAPGDEGLYVMGDYVKGENLSNTANSLSGFQAVAAYNIRMKSPDSFFYAVEPAFRYDVADPNTNAVNDKSTLITGGLNLYLTSKAQIRVMYESQSFQDPAVPTISGVRSALTMNF